MKKTRYFISLLLLVAITISIISLSACKKDEDSNLAPALPPQAGFVMNFNDFSVSEDTLKSGLVTENHNNWGYSYLNVAVWNTVLTVGLAVPVASFAEAFNHDAVYHPDENNWTWSYNFTVGFTAYLAELTGALEGDSAAWEMRITKSGSYSNFLWYQGKSAINQSGGYWILMESPEHPNNLLKIDWNNYSDGTVDIKYTNIKPGSNENGGYIYYGTVIGDLNRFYKIYNKGLNNLTEIEWSSLLKNGRVKDPHHFNTTGWNCWDNNLLDVVCP